MPTYIFRVTVKGRFAGLDDETRARMLAVVDQRDELPGGYTDAGTFDYDRRIDFFTFRVQLRELSDDWQEAHNAVCDRAQVMALATLDDLGAGHRDLKVRASDMADVWR